MTRPETTNNHTCNFKSDGDLSNELVPGKTLAPGWLCRKVSLFSKTITHSGLISLIDQAVASATNFLTGIILARNCSREEFGLYMLGFSIILFVLDLQTSLISAPYMVYSQRLSDRKHSIYLGSSLLHQFMLSIMVVLSLVIVSSVLSSGIGTIDLLPVTKALVPIIFFIMLREFIRRICFAGMKMRAALIVDSSVATVQLGGLLLLACFCVLSARTAFFCIGAACSITTLIWLVANRHSYSFIERQFIKDFKKNLAFGKWTFASSLLWTLSMTLYPWLLAFFHGTAATGIWAACWGIIAMANPLFLGIQNFLGPKIVQSYSKGGAIELRRFVIRITGKYCLIILPLALVLFIFGDELIVLFYGEQYSGNGNVVAVLAVNLVVMAASFTISRALLAIEKTRIYFMANIIPLIIILTLGVLLVQRLGPLGVAWGIFISTATTAGIMIYLFLNIIKTFCSMESNQ